MKTDELRRKGASDNQVFELAKKTNTILVTRDKQFILYMLGNHNPVVDYNGGVLITPKIEKYIDFRTDYILRNREIVIP